MEEHEAILKDLKEYLDGKGVETDVERFIGIWYLDNFIDYFSIELNCIVENETKSIVSLVDPGYKEKFYEYLVNKKDIKNVKIVKFF